MCGRRRRPDPARTELNPMNASALCAPAHWLDVGIVRAKAVAVKRSLQPGGNVWR
jgi:hypothetical protein